MSKKSLWKPASILMVALVVGLLAAWGLRSDVSACTSVPEAAEVTVQPVAPLASGAEATSPAPSGRVPVTDDLDNFGIVAPVFTGFGIDTYSSKCDPFSDPYGSCL